MVGSSSIAASTTNEFEVTGMGRISSNSLLLIVVSSDLSKDLSISTSNYVSEF